MRAKAEEETKVEILESNVFTAETFEDLEICDKLKQILKELGYDRLTAI